MQLQADLALNIGCRELFEAGPPDLGTLSGHSLASLLIS
jgi:hypothetical protein